MNKSRLIELFSALSKSEKRELGKFVNSPIYNQRQDVVDLYLYLYKNHSKKEPETLQRAFVFGLLFPSEKYDQAKMDHTMSFLFKATKSYIIFKEQELNSEEQAILFARSLRKRNLNRLFEKEIKVVEQAIRKQPYRDADYHYNNFRLHLEKHIFAKQKSRVSTESFKEFSEELTKYFLAKKLWEACTLVTHKTVAVVELQEEELLEAILNLVEENGYSDIPAINLYYYCYKALTEKESLPWFDKLRQLIKMQYTSLPTGEVKDLYLVAINYCIRRFNNGEKDFLKEAFSLYKEGLSLGTFLENNILSRFTYNNIVMAGLMLKDFLWVKGFLSEYKGYIEPRYRESTFNYNLAFYYFHKPDYERAIDLLQQTDFDDVMHNLNARKMMLQIFMEKDEREVLGSWLLSFKNFIYRHKELGSYQKDRYLNLIKFTRRVLSVKPYDREEINALKIEIEKAEQVIEKAWLLKILEKI